MSTQVPAALRRTHDVVTSEEFRRRCNDIGLLGARIGLAWIFIYHGAGTLFGAFRGPGIHGMAAYFASTAHLHPATFFAVLGGITEFFGGIAVGFGLLSRLAAVGLFFDMVIAMVTVTFKNGLVSHTSGSGYEINVALAALALVILACGAGRIATDYALGAFIRSRRPMREGAITPQPS